ncbi:MAG: hypothetical protein C0490_04650, partial [Marivirga sp.]|nr:hypothetical protein [Marivirga sp.]
MLCLFLGCSLNGLAQALVPKNIGATTPLSWGDYDNDGDMDLLQFNGAALRILKNNLVGTTATFADAGITLVNLNPSSAGWIDFNSDGYLDIFYLETGNLKVFISQKGVSFIQTTINLSGESLSTIADWGDIDSDGDLDLLGGGVIMKNLGSNRFELSQRLGSAGRTELLDFDNDGDLDFFSRDFLYTNKGDGVFELDRSISPNGSDSDYEYQDLLLFGSENGNKKFASYYRFDTSFGEIIDIWDFFLCGGGNSGMTIKFLKIADFDNDGKNDVLISENGSVNLYSSVMDCMTIAELPVPAGRTEVADFDKDGDLDVFIGDNVYENTTVTANAAPSVPASLTSVVDSLSQKPSVTLSWSAATDDKTPSTSLTYNLIIKRGPDVVFTDGLGASGKQVLTQHGNVGFRNALKIFNLPKGKYSWTVQAIDQAFKPSGLAVEKQFAVGVGPDLITALPISTRYASSYDEVKDRYLLTYIKNGDVMGVYVDGKAVQPSGTEFKINTTSTATSHIATFNATRNEFMVSWLEVSGNNKKVYAKNLLATGANSHAEKVIYTRSDTLKVFLGQDKIVVEPVSGKYMIPVLQTRTDLSRPRVVFFDEPYTYYPYGLIDVFGVKFASNGTTITNEAPKLLQTKSIPDIFNNPSVRNFTIESSADFDSKKKLYVVAWNFLGELRATYGSGSSSEITSVLRPDDIKVIVADENLLTKSENAVAGGGTPRNLSTVYNTISDQLILVWSSWQESTNAAGSNDYKFEIYQQIFSLQNSGTAQFRNDVTLVSKPPEILDYGSGLPTLSWSRKRNEYLIVWNKGIAGSDLGVLGEGDIFWRRVSPVTFGFIDSDSRFISGLTGNESITGYNGKAGHFLLGWRSASQNYLSAFNIPKDLTKPKLTNISPDIAAAGAKVVITASNIGNTPIINKVMFGSIEAVVDPVFPFPNDPTKIQVTVPSGLTREKVRVVVTYDDQSSVEEIMFENITPSSVTNVAPLQGEEGDLITITGTNFPADKNNFKVMFGSTEAALADITSNTVSEIKVKVPQAAKRGSHKIAVVIQDITNEFAGGDFRVIRVPVISSVDPDDEDQEKFIAFRNIRVTGTNLSQQSGDLTIRLNDNIIPPGNISVATATELVFRIPMGLRGEHELSVSSVDGEVLHPEKFVIFLGSAVEKKSETTEIKFTKTNDEVNLFVEVLSRRTVQELKFWSKGISAQDTEWKSQSLTGLFDNNRVDFAITEAEFTDDPLG